MNKINTNNSNKEFTDFSKNDLNLHWSYSNFFRYLYTCEQIVKHKSEMILEIGASNSPMKEMLKENFKYDPAKFIRCDVTNKLNEDIMIVDVTDGLNYSDNTFDVVILEEVLEHIDVTKHAFVLSEIKRVLKIGGILLFSTPTPIKEYEGKCWPEDHDFEYSYDEITNLISEYFLIEQDMVWSNNIKEYNSLVTEDPFSREVFARLRTRMPDGFVQAIVSLLAPQQSGRQIILTAIKKTK